jgi:hypothetical protein
VSAAGAAAAAGVLVGRLALGDLEGVAAAARGDDVRVVDLEPGPLSKPSAYSNPEQPPPWTAMRRTVASPSGSSSISSRTFAAADSVSETRLPVRSAISTKGMVPGWSEATKRPSL